ncbi:relaxase domain-containing protein [Corynebacterium phoceense]|uniref:MobF family relaxase n=1 Tax=Corynebacterium phoceense TaxID=1686286 RepID=UPI00211CF10F|nr:MobF family relaxase [Corynebacterium phoceense]MCQ9334497.1 relaxase domain-containing protein [Corynebacterium phoceense]
MMSFRAVHAGSGYQYLLRSVATNDAPDSTVEEGKLSSYYQAKGTPPGRWIGRGLEGIGSETVRSGAEIEAEQMEALYGLGLHPDTHSLLEAGKKLDECKLGGKFPVYTNDIPVLSALRAAEQSFVEKNNRLLTDEERTDLAVSIGREYYVEATGWVDAPDKDVIDWVNLQRNQVKQAVAGFDLTFSPAKSVSVLWALADEDTASKIAACHHEAVAEVLAWAEDNVVRTRMGAGGLAQVQTRGIVASEFTHFDTRAGDPDLHSHVLVSNKVQGPDGKWRAIDGRPMFKNNQTLSARYDAVVQEILSRKMGLSFEAHSRGEGKEPVWEVAGVPEDLIDHFAKRRTMARPVYENLLADYVASHGHQPDKRTQKELWQAAILDTRDAKKPAESLDTLRTNWRAEVASLDEGKALLGRLRAVTAGAHMEQRPEFFADANDPSAGLDEHSRVVIDRMVQKRSYFAIHHITAAVGSYLKGFSFSSQEQVQAALSSLTDYIVEHRLVEITPTRDMALPQALQQDGEVGIDRHIGYRKFTTPEILAQEDKVLRAVVEPVPVFADSAELDTALNAFEESHGFSLNEGQVALAKHLLQSGTLLACGIGPAGTGKTTSMQVVTDTWHASGRAVVGLAPSAAAASVLSDELGINAHTIDTLSFVWRGRHPNKPAGDLSALPIEINPGDMLLVDEAGMATTDNLAALTEIAEESGAVVRFIGDPQQLDAVGTGGLFASMCRFNDAAELTDVMRFEHGNDTEQADASLAVRRGDTDAVSFYESRGWVTGGTRDALLVDAVDAYLADTARGRKSLIIATTNADVAALNEMIRAHFIDSGEVDTGREVQLAQAETAGIGDVIIARQNQRLANPHDPNAPGPKVINGQLFRVLEIGADGSVTAGDTSTGEVYELPADYVSEHTHLGYAATVYRAQGATVDTTHAVVDSSTSRASLYVALTRGKRENRVYAVTDDYLDEFAEQGHEHSAGNAPGLSAHDVIVNAIARDGRQRSATEIRTEAEEYAGSRERLERLYQYGCEQATADFIDRHMDAWWDCLDTQAHDSLTEEGKQKVRAVWKHVIAQGQDPRLMMPTAIFNLGNAEETGAVIAWRLRDQAHQVDATATGLESPPPATRGGDSELLTWLHETYDKLVQDDAAEATDNEEEQGDNLDVVEDVPTRTVAAADLSPAERLRAQFRRRQQGYRPAPETPQVQHHTSPGLEL